MKVGISVLRDRVCVNALAGNFRNLDEFAKDLRDSGSSEIAVAFLDLEKNAEVEESQIQVLNALENLISVGTEMILCSAVETLLVKVFEAGQEYERKKNVPAQVPPSTLGLKLSQTH